jgi:hypothetical protein
MAKRITFKLYDHEIELVRQFSEATQTDMDKLAKQCLMFTIHKAYELAKQEADNAEIANRKSESNNEASLSVEASDTTALADSEKNGDS